MGVCPIVCEVSLPDFWENRCFVVVNCQRSDIADNIVSVYQFLTDQFLFLCRIVKILKLQESKSQSYNNNSGDNREYDYKFVKVGRDLLLEFGNILNEIFLADINS